jgi:hypothetical protein
MRPRWPAWKVVAAYLIMALLAAASVWFVDRKVHLLPRRAVPEQTQPVQPKAGSGRTPAVGANFLPA